MKERERERERDERSVDAATQLINLLYKFYQTHTHKYTKVPKVPRFTHN